MGFTLGLVAICFMSGFSGFPAEVNGDVVVSFKNYITISVKNINKTETIEMTFLKSKCKVKK